MFCPKCGNNCGDNRFCGRCGAQVQEAAVQEPQQPAWSVGMACPHCGGTQLEGNHCAFCGAQLIADVSEEYGKESEYASIPFGAYKGCNSFLQLDEQGVLIRRAELVEHRIPYGEITAVGLREYSLFSYAWLTFRWTENAHLPLPEKYFQACNDETTFFYFKKNEAVVWQIYYAIKEIVEKNNGVARIL